MLWVLFVLSITLVAGTAAVVLILRKTEPPPEYADPEARDVTDEAPLDENTSASRPDGHAS